jgi:Sulfatase
MPMPIPNRQPPLFLILLPVFFILHGLQENEGFVPAGDALLLLMVYLVAAFALFGLCWLFFRNRLKAAMGSFLLMAFHFFFGGIHDVLKRFAGEQSFITKYSVLLPLFVVLFVIAFIWLKRTRSPLRKATVYLNLLFVILIAWDGIMLLLPKKAESEAKYRYVFSCDTCKRPDIFLIVLDEYAGHEALKDLFQFDNSVFENQLKENGFHVVPDSRSNYNYTPFSIASMLNMKYLQLKDTDRDKPELTYAFQLINQNLVRRILEDNGYEFYNHSVFNLPDQPAPVEESFIPARTRLITGQTFLSRLERDLGYHLTKTFKIKSVIRHQAYRELRNNTKLYDLTEKLAAAPRSKPRFVYTHLMMPHYPYYFDRNGKPMDPARVLPEANNMNRADYVEYLQYTNKKIFDLAQHILRNSQTPPVIMIMSDHGFRHFNEPVDRKYYFMNLNAVYLPGKNYSGFHQGFTNVNQFRAAFNSLFETKFRLLKDTSIYLKD